MKLQKDVLIYILNECKIYYGNETKIIKNLLMYYNKQKDNNLKEVIADFLKRIELNNINFYGITKYEMKLLNEIYEMKNIIKNQNIKMKINNMKLNEIIKDIIIKYYQSDYGIIDGINKYI